jgi:hypothetical protein
MKLKFLSVLTFAAACLIFAGTGLAAGPGAQGSGFSRQPMNSGASNYQRGAMHQEMRGEQRMERMQQRGQRPIIEGQQPRAILPDQAGDTARAAVEHAGMGEGTAEAVRARTRSMEEPQEVDTTSPIASELQ